MLYLRLRQHLPNERAALAAMQTFSPFGAAVSARRIPRDDGSATTRYVVLVPGGRRPSSVIKQLTTQAPHSEWALVDVDADGFETEVTAEAPA